MKLDRMASRAPSTAAYFSAMSTPGVLVAQLRFAGSGEFHGDEGAGNVGRPRCRAVETGWCARCRSRCPRAARPGRTSGRPVASSPGRSVPESTRHRKTARLAGLRTHVRARRAGRTGSWPRPPARSPRGPRARQASGGLLVDLLVARGQGPRPAVGLEGAPDQQHPAAPVEHDPGGGAGRGSGRARSGSPGSADARDPRPPRGRARRHTADSVSLVWCHTSGSRSRLPAWGRVRISGGCSTGPFASLNLRSPEVGPSRKPSQGRQAAAESPTRRCPGAHEIPARPRKHRLDRNPDPGRGARPPRGVPHRGSVRRLVLSTCCSRQVREFRPRFVAVIDPDAAQRVAGELPPEVSLLDRRRPPCRRSPQRRTTTLAVHGVVGGAGLVASVRRARARLGPGPGEQGVPGDRRPRADGARPRARRVRSCRSTASCARSTSAWWASAATGCAAIHLTASGGPFRDLAPEEIERATRPTWRCNTPPGDMGPRITVGSATLMNKALEVIEVHHLFGMEPEQDPRRRPPAVDRALAGRVRRRIGQGAARPARHAHALGTTACSIPERQPSDLVGFDVRTALQPT